jgi:hypothetical protein
MRLSLASAALLLAWATSACSGKVTPTAGLMIVMRTDGTLQPDKLRVNIASPDGQTPYRKGDYTIPPYDLPATLAIASNGDPTASVLIDVSVWKKGQPLDERQNQVQQIPTDRVAELDIVFSANCTPTVTYDGTTLGSTCGASTTCDPATGHCTGNVVVNGKDLPTFSGDAGPMATEDASGPEDAPNDAANTTTGDSGNDGGDATVTVTDAPSGSESSPPDVSSSDAQADASAPVDATVDAPAGMDATSDVTPTPDGGDPEIDYGTQPVTLTMSPFQVAPGQEIVECQTFANPWGRQVDVKSYSSTMGSGALGMFAFYVTNASAAAVAACPSGVHQWGQFTFSAENAQTTLHYPPTVGATIAATTGFQLAARYINSGSSAVNPSPAATLTMYVAKPSVVTSHAGVLFLNQNAINLPPGVSQASAMYPLPQAVNIIQSSSMMNRYGTNFDADASAGTLDQTTSWNQPQPTDHSPALALAGGAVVTWTCTENNTTGSTLTYNGMMSTGAMCVSVSAIYPVTDPANPVIGGSL